MEDYEANAGFELNWWEAEGEELVGGVDIEATCAEVREAFELLDDAYPGDCLVVTATNLKWLRSKTEIQIDLNKYEYTLDIFSKIR